MRNAFGFDIGGTNIKFVAAGENGDVLERGTVPTRDGEFAATYWVTAIRGLVAELSGRLGAPSGIGISAPGLAARDGRSIAWMQGRMSAVQGLDWTAALGLDIEVGVLNDAQAALLGESWCGAAAGAQDVLMLTLGTGVGGACLVDGSILKGNIGRAGHLGHICLNPDGTRDIVNTPGSLEDAIGECTLQARSMGRFQSTEALVRAYLAGDSFAATVWLRSVYMLSCGLASLINVTDPEIVILGGGVAAAGSALLEPLKAWLDEFEWRPTGSRVRLVQAALGEYAGALGAARSALR